MTKEQRQRLEQIRYDLDNGVTTYLCLEAINNLYDELNCLESLENEEKEKKNCNGHLIINSSHHDGSDSYEMKILTKKGFQHKEASNEETNCN